MNPKRKKHSCIRFILVLCLLAGGINCSYASSKPIDHLKKCSLTLTYADGTDPIEGMEIEITRVAEVNIDAFFEWTTEFSSYSFSKVRYLKSQTEWKDLADTITAYVIADKIEPTAVQTTDEDGKVKFTGLKTGLYYIRWNGNAISAVYGFDPFMIALPSLDNEGGWVYDVDAIPKPGGNLNDGTHDTYSAVKVWADEGSEKRPVSIEIDIYCDGEFFQTVELNKENNWNCLWGSEGTHEWNVVETKVPENYTVSINKNEASFIITNTFKLPPDDPPETGDVSHVDLWTYVMAASGIILIALYFLKKKKDHE